ncbi:hypothetical protein SNEBB_001522 [Seison nebaliae]|nr:hypothetical protein SNEBB_001522 [Seison nebaliae]
MERDSRSIRQQLEYILESITGKDFLEDALKQIEGLENQEFSDEEYRLIVDINNFTQTLDLEFKMLNEFIIQLYSRRFPELAQLVYTSTARLGSMNYIKTVRELGNEVDEKVKNTKNLEKFLTPAVIMIVCVSASTTSGRLLNEEELSCVMEACDFTIQLETMRENVFNYVKSRLHFIAPNLSALVGETTAARLIGLAGGIGPLAQMPSCNLVGLGSGEDRQTGFASKTAHVGIIYDSEFVQSMPPDLRRKAARMMTNKCTLAIRIDSQLSTAARAEADCSEGEKLRKELEKTFEKLQEPPPVKQIKPLAAPIDKARPRRGGRRHRRMKELFGMSDIKKQVNRTTFGEIEDDAYQEDLGFSAGQFGQQNTGRIRSAQVDAKTKAKISHKLHKHLLAAQASSPWNGASTSLKSRLGINVGSLANAGTTSVAFTPMQGFEIINQTKNEEIDLSGIETAKYFRNNAGFAKVKSVVPKM